MLTTEERALMIEVAENYPYDIPADSWGYGPMGAQHPWDVDSDMIVEFG